MPTDESMELPEFYPERQDPFPSVKERIIHNLLKKNRRDVAQCRENPLEDIYLTAYKEFSSGSKSIRCISSEQLGQNNLIN